MSADLHKHKGVMHDRDAGRFLDSLVALLSQSSRKAKEDYDNDPSALHEGKLLAWKEAYKILMDGTLYWTLNNSSVVTYAEALEKAFGEFPEEKMTCHIGSGIFGHELTPILRGENDYLLSQDQWIQFIPSYDLSKLPNLSRCDATSYIGMFSTKYDELFDIEYVPPTTE